MENLAQQLRNSRLHRHLFFLILSAIAITFIGYRFGTFDQTFHIPFLKTYANPALYPTDPIVELRWQNYSFFWHGLQPFYELDLHFGFDEPYILQTVMFLAHVFCTYLTFWAIWVLSETLFNNPLTSLLAVCSFLVYHMGQSVFPLIEFSLLNRTFALPFVLFSLTLQLQKRTWLAFGLLGLLFNLHIITALFGLAMLACDCLLNWRQVGWKKIVIGPLIFILMALPVLLWKAGSGDAPTDLSIRPDWYDFIVRSVLYHLYQYWGVGFLNMMTLGGVGVSIMYLIARRYAPSTAHALSQDAFFLAPMLVILFQSIFMYFYPVTFLMELQLMRAGLFSLLIAYVSFANYLASRYKPNDADWALLCGTTLLGPSPLIVPVLWGLQHWLPAWRGRIVLTTLTVLGLFAAFVIYLYPYKDVPVIGVDIYPAHTDWYQAQRWARDHTALDAIFITPPQIWSYNDSDWRVFSERGTLASLADALEIALIPEYQAIWQPRFEALAPGAMAQFKGDYFENKLITAGAFYSLTPARLEEIALEYKASYLVVEKPNTRPFTLCYENPQYIIYALTETAAKQAECAAQ